MRRLITTGEAARELGVSTATLTRWAADPHNPVTPAERTAGGHYRWDLAILRGQVRRLHPGRERVVAEEIAAVIHDANRRLQIIIGEPRPSPPWDEAPEYQARECIAGVELYLDNPRLTPEASHEAWCDRMRADGWTHGPVKDEAAKTHPLLVPWDEVPVEHQRKDLLFAAIVRALAP
jgi:DNA-binding transcriptional MerR regulator